MKNKAFLIQNLKNLKEEMQNSRNQLTQLPEGKLYLEKTDEKQLFLLKKEIEGKASRVSVTRNLQLRNALLKKELLKAEISILENNIKLLQHASETYLELSLENIIAGMPARFQKLPRELWIEALSGSEWVSGKNHANNTNSTNSTKLLRTRDKGIMINTKTNINEKINRNINGNIEVRPMSNLINCNGMKVQYGAKASIERNKVNSSIIGVEGMGKGILKSCEGKRSRKIEWGFDIDRYSPEVIAWATAPYEQSTYKQEGRVHRTSRGLMVRSKSELIIVELLYTYRVPLRYEQILLADGTLMIPDFIVPGRKYDFYYWEHCGMPHDKEYMKRHREKLEKYEALGIAPWTNLIVTYDDEEGNFDLQAIESEIKNKLL